MQSLSLAAGNQFEGSPANLDFTDWIGYGGILDGGNVADRRDAVKKKPLRLKEVEKPEIELKVKPLSETEYFSNATQEWYVWRNPVFSVPILGEVKAN